LDPKPSKFNEDYGNFSQQNFTTQGDELESGHQQRLHQSNPQTYQFSNTDEISQLQQTNKFTSPKGLEGTTSKPFEFG